ncbi:MAG: Lrp/AsnC ligand binding domain-containing protein [Nitrososphaeria archaeon]|nr:Lrp/AsnC ligand binding domain-containing protein [Nitrososphaeria archaeon]
MPTAFVLINADSGSERKLLEQIRKMDGVKEAYLVYGTFDIIAKVETKSLEELREHISIKTRKLDNVLSTMTLIVAD